MPRVKLSEYRAKKLLLGDMYGGISICESGEALTGALRKTDRKARYVVKVDQGIKHRMKRGLVYIDLDISSVPDAIREMRKKNFSQFLVEPFIPHSSNEERYLSFERTKEGISLIYAKSGGINIESIKQHIETYIVTGEKNLNEISKKINIPLFFMRQLCRVFEENYFSFLEINPLIISAKDGGAYPLDAAVLVDSVAGFLAPNWREEDIVELDSVYSAEKEVEALAKTSSASFKLKLLNPNGSLFFLLSGGGGSIVVVDEAQMRGVGGEIGNYGEYSGGPTRQETFLYAQAVLSLLLQSNAKRKALVIAGGIANFTDIKQTFFGIIDALSEVAERLRRARVKVFVRRGGPHEQEGLMLIRNFLEQEGLLGSVHGSETLITKAVDEAAHYIQE